MVVMKPIPGQETRNAGVLKSNNAAFLMDRPEEIVPIMKSVLDDPSVLERKRRAIEHLARPRAVEDLVDFVLEGESPCR
jgi:UDP-N-acetylglucosamine:LPS N-acetylglucosamine transferase